VDGVIIPLRPKLLPIAGEEDMKPRAFVLSGLASVAYAAAPQI